MPVIDDDPQQMGAGGFKGELGPLDLLAGCFPGSDNKGNAIGLMRYCHRIDHVAVQRKDL